MKTFRELVLETMNWAIKKLGNKLDLDENNSEQPKKRWSGFYELVELNVEKVMRNVNAETGMGLDITKSDGGKNAKSFRLSRARQHKAKGGYFDPPTISYNDLQNFVEFDDGRHRAFVAYQMGEKTIPFFVPKRQKNFFIKNFS